MIKAVRKRKMIMAILASVTFCVFVALIIFLWMTRTMEHEIPLNKLIGQFDEKKDPQFVALDSTVLPVNKRGMYLQKEATAQLINVYHAFTKAHPDIPFIVISATRNYDYQNGIWLRKWKMLQQDSSDPKEVAKQILRFSSMPGTSRHHWGSDVDITSLSSPFFQQDKKGKILYQWLVENMPKYDFCQSFNKGRNGGYMPEEWHWSYRPIAKEYIRQYQQILDHDPAQITSKLTFTGHDKINLHELVREYVLNVNPDCY